MSVGLICWILTATEQRSCVHNQSSDRIMSVHPLSIHDPVSGLPLPGAKLAGRVPVFRIWVPLHNWLVWSYPSLCLELMVTGTPVCGGGCCYGCWNCCCCNLTRLFRLPLSERIFDVNPAEAHAVSRPVVIFAVVMGMGAISLDALLMVPLTPWNCWDLGTNSVVLKLDEWFVWMMR